MIIVEAQMGPPYTIGPIFTCFKIAIEKLKYTQSVTRYCSLFTKIILVSQSRSWIGRLFHISLNQPLSPEIGQLNSHVLFEEAMV